MGRGAQGKRGAFFVEGTPPPLHQICYIRLMWFFLFRLAEKRLDVYLHA